MYFRRRPPVGHRTDFGKRDFFSKHPSKTTIAVFRSTNPDKSLIGKMKPGGEALEF